MMHHFFNRREVEQRFSEGSWQKVSFAEFSAAMTTNAHPFPCVFAIEGFQEDQLRYVFLDTISVPTLACSLARYLADARQFGTNTSLVVFTRPGPVCPLDHYRSVFWSMLHDLVRIDGQPWPENIPKAMDDPKWEFSFAGEPVFVVCTTPAHIARQSRRSTGFMITFQPRWVFDKILGTAKTTEAAFANITKRLKRYDFIQPSPHLGHYGDPNNREYRQYFLDDDNGTFEYPFEQ